MFGEKNIEKMKKERTVKLKKFYKKLGVLGESQEKIDRAVIEFAKGKVYPFDIILSETQQKDPKFMIELMKANKHFAQGEYYARELKSNVDFKIEMLKIVLGDKKEYSKLDTYDYHYEIKYEREVKAVPGFWAKFAENFPDCNILELMHMELEQNLLGYVSQEQFGELVGQLPRGILFAQARKFGHKMFAYLPKNHAEYNNLLATSVECDGFKTFGNLSKDEILANRYLIVKATEVSGFEGLVSFFRKDLSMHREREYMCHGELHCSHWDDVEYIPLQKELIEDDSLFDRMNLSKEDLSKLEQFRKSISSDIEKFYESVKPYKERNGGLSQAKAGDKSVQITMKDVLDSVEDPNAVQITMDDISIQFAEGGSGK